MITCSPPRLESDRWQRELADAISDPAELLRLLGIEARALPYAPLSAPGFALKVPRYFVGLMRQGDPHDPLLAQVLPLAIENLHTDGFDSDPVGDLAASQGNGVLQKYHGRALMITTGACAVHCRYCFRRHYPYAEQSLLRHWRGALATLSALPEVNELILSGGDPLTLSDRRLGQLLQEAEAIPQLQRLRIHTRLPVVLPNRITGELADLFATTRLKVVWVIHANHPHEITPELGHAMRRLRTPGSLLLNQSVLLKSVNDDADILETLSESLFGIGVLPYYLHLLDPVAGAAHFDVALDQAEALMRSLRARLPGYLVPKAVREIPGEPGKTPIQTC